MAISRESIQKAVDYYLPQTINPSRDERTGRKDTTVSHERLVQIFLASLQLDPDSLFYLVFLTTQRLEQLVDDTRVLLEQLRGSDYLLAAEAPEPTGVSSTAALTTASSALNLMGASLQEGKINTRGLDRYQESIEGFLAEQIKPDVVSRNRRLLEVDIRRNLSQLKTSWEKMYTQYGAVLGALAAYQGSGLAQKASKATVSSVRARLGYLQAFLDQTNANQHGLVAETIMADLAASHAVLGLVAAPTSATGSVIVSLAIDGFTESEYLETQGFGYTNPAVVIESGSMGRPQTIADLTGIRGSVTGSSPASTFSDVAGNFLALPSDPQGYFLLIVDEGTTLPRAPIGTVHRVVSVNGSTSIEVSPEINTGGVGKSDLRWAVSSRHPGSLFRDKSGTKSWVDEYTPASTSESVLASGTLGSIDQYILASGTGTNLKAQRSTGTAIPFQEQDTAHVVPGGTGVVQFTGTTLLSSGIDTTRHVFYFTDGGLNDLGSSYEILSVDSDTQLTLNAVLTVDLAGGTWVVADPAAFRDDTFGDFLTDGVAPGDQVDVDNGSTAIYDGNTYTVVDLISFEEFTVTPTFSGPTQVNSLDYDIFYSRDALYDENASFYTDDIEVGDEVDITGIIGTITVAAIVSPTRLQLDTNVDAYSGNAYSVLDADTASISDRFSQLDGVDFTTLLTADGFVGGEQAYIVLGGSYIKIEEVIDASTVRLAETSSTSVSGLTWSLQTGDTTNILEDPANTPFLSYEEGDLVVINPGASDEIRAKIVTVLSAASVELDVQMDVGLSGLSYWVASTVLPGQELLSSSRRVNVVDIYDAQTVVVSPPMSQTVGTGLEYQIVNRGQSRTTRRLTDDSANFLDDLRGKTIEVQLDTPLVARILTVPDQYTLELDLPMPLGLRQVPYRVLAFDRDLSDTFQTTDADAADVLTDDHVGIWGITDPRSATTDATGAYSFDVAPLLPARLTSQEYAVTRGGSAHYPKYLLFESKAIAASPSADTSDLRNNAAQFLIDFGQEVISTIATATGTGGIEDDQEGNDTTTWFEDSTVDFISAGARVGDRLIINGSTYVYLSETPTLVNRVVFTPGIEDVAVTTWTLDRTSTSETLYEVDLLETSMAALLAALQGFVVPRNPTIDALVDSLQSRNMDRAVDLLYQGKLDEFVDLLESEGNYATKARVNVQEAGRLVIPPSTRLNFAGTDTAPVTPLSRARLVEASNAKVDLSRALNELGASERAAEQVDLDYSELVASAVYELTGEVRSNLVLDRNATLPWLKFQGSKLDQIKRLAQSALNALQYIIDNPDQFEDGT